MKTEVLSHVPARVATHYRVFPLELEGDTLQLASPEDLSREAREELRITLDRKIAFVPRSKADIEDLILKFYGVGAGVIETLTQEINQDIEVYDFEVIDSHKKEDVTIIKLVNELFSDALKWRASDIHIEPFEKSLRIRYRVDGLLQDARVSGQIRMLAPQIISRVKIMAKLDIGEKRLPQDGRIKIKFKNGSPTKSFGDDRPVELDLRVSVLPSSFGESIVIRILKPLELLELSGLGFDEQGIMQMKQFLKKPHGVILITGPTGSGKTTTLYSFLKELNQTERKIITIEDPVEYKLPGIIQMQVNSKIDFTFARALRSILRHDPDCIMIGEIRDAETAEIAIRSALTGHLVFSTLHTNDAPSAVTRLVEMGVEPYLVASALEGVIAQRLVRKTCVPCEKCGQTGFHGRIAVSEIMPVTEEIRDLVLNEKTGSIIRKTALKNGMQSLYDNGLAKVRQGLTGLDEIERVVSL